MDQHILKFVWRHSRSAQIRVVLLTLMAFPLLYMTLEIPKWIINNALGDSESVKQLFGVSFGPVEYLVVLCISLIVLIILSGLLKMVINTWKGVIGERLIRRLRFSLISTLLRFPLHHFSSVSPGEMISTVSSETEPLAGYIGESIALPLFQGGTMITILIFMFAQNWVFGLVSVVLIPVQGYVIPKLQRQINLLKKDRIRRVRKLSERIGETVSGAAEIRLHGTEKYTLAEFSRRFGDLFWVRLEIFRKKYYMKFLNNTIGQITPFFYYLFGGYLVIQGTLTLGALVAAIAAYKDLTSPWRELLNHYQLHEDAKIKYQQIVATFDVQGLLDEQTGSNQEVPGFLPHPLVVEQLGWSDNHGNELLSGIDLHAETGSLIAISGGGGAQRARLAQLLSGLLRPDAGTIRFGELSVQEIPQNLLRTRLSLQGPDPHIFSGTIVENMEYGLNQREPVIEIEDSLSRDVVEAEASGNIHPLTTDWVDYHIASGDDGIQNRDWYTSVVRAIGAEDLIYQRSLFEVFDPLDWPELAERLLEARGRVGEALVSANLQCHIDRIDQTRFNNRSTILENILFGTLNGNLLTVDALTNHPWVRQALNRCNVLKPAVELGHQIAKRLLSLKLDLGANDDLLVHFRMTDPHFAEQLAVAMDSYSSFAQSRQSTHPVFLSIFMQLIPDTHPIPGFSEDMAAQLLRVRELFQSEIPEDISQAIVPFDEHQYHPGLSVRDNLLFGRLRGQDQGAGKQIGEIVSAVVDQLELRTDLMILFGESQVGVGGANLSVPERHTIALGRSLMKRPDLMIFNDALSPFDERDQLQMLERIRELLPYVTIIWIDRKLDNPSAFDTVYRFTDRGSIENLSTRKSVAMQVAENGKDATATTDRFSLISDSVLFSSLNVSQQGFLADHSSLVAFDRGITVYQLGDPADAVWLVVRGEVESKREGQRVGLYREHDVFGSIETLAERDRMLTLQTTRKSTLLRIEADALERIASGDATVSRSLLRVLARQWSDDQG